jgi:hypothetical protein
MKLRRSRLFFCNGAGRFLIATVRSVPLLGLDFSCFSFTAAWTSAYLSSVPTMEEFRLSWQQRKTVPPQR